MDIIWVGVAFIFGFIVSRIELPPLVGYLAAGLALAGWGYEPGEMLKEISHLGVIFLLFTVGLHIRIKNIVRIDILGVGLTHLIISTAVFTPVCLWFGFDLQAAVIISITLGFSSTVLTAKNLEMRNEVGAFYGRTAIQGVVCRLSGDYHCSQFHCCDHFSSDFLVRSERMNCGCYLVWGLQWAGPISLNFSIFRVS
jgi:predicted Kef-type K+ transport protein